MSNFNVNIEWTPKKVEQKIANGDKEIKKVMKEALEEAVEETSKEAQGVLGKRKITKGARKIQDSIMPGHPQSLGKVISAQKAEAGSKYPGVNLIEDGTKPHSVGWTPINEWMRENQSALGVSDIDAMTYKLIEHIKKHGTEAVQFMSGGLKEAQPSMQKIIDKAAEKITERLGLK